MNLPAAQRYLLEAQRRHQARLLLRDFIPYVASALPLGGAGWIMKPHHAAIIEALQPILDGKARRIVLTVPPRHGKSFIATQCFPAMFLGRQPEKRVIVAGYSTEFAEREFGRKTRHIMTSTPYARLFPNSVISADLKARDEFATIAGGQYLATGVMGVATGKGAHLAIIDDPFRDRLQAQSSLMRERVWEWYRTVLGTRLQAGASVVIIMTRWHLDDLVGRVLAQAPQIGAGQAAEGAWEVIDFPALALENDRLGRAPGEALWPEMFPATWLETQRATMGESNFQALYQQRPVASEGSLFKVSAFRLLDRAPDCSERVRRWDLAATSATSGDPDWTAGVLMGRDGEGRVVVLDVQRTRAETAERDAFIRRVAQIDGPGTRIVIPQDPGAAGKGQVAWLTRLLEGYPVTAERETGSKELRADPFASQVNAGNVDMVRGAWNLAFLEEAKAFPFGGHDDQVDAASGAFSYLVQNDSGTLPVSMIDPSLLEDGMEDFGGW